MTSLRFARILAAVLLVGSLGVSSNAPSGWRLVASNSSGSDVAAGNDGSASGTSAPPAAPAPQAAPAGPPSVQAAPATIPSDCSKDVTRAILNWIASVPDGSTLVFAQNGCYRIDGSLIVMDRSGLTFEGNGATFKAVADGDQNRAHWWFFGSSDLVLRNMTVIGPHKKAGPGNQGGEYRPDREFQHAYALQGVQGALLENLQGYNVYGDFVYIDSDGGQKFRPRPRYNRTSSDVTVRNSHFERNGRHGVSLISVNNATIEGNYIGDIQWDAVDIEPDNARQAVQHVRFIGNTTGRIKLVWFGISGPSANISDILIADNTMARGSGVPVIFADGRNAPAGAYWGPFTVRGNAFNVGWSSRAGFQFARAADVLFQGNSVAMPGTKYAKPQDVVKLQNSHRVRVVGNTLTGKVRQILVADTASYDYQEAGNTVR